MSLPTISIRNPVFAWMLMLGFMVFGAIAFGRLGLGQYPDVDVPEVSVSATLEGAAPEIMESEVVDLLEDTLSAVEGVKQVTSKAEQGRASITLEFDIERDIDLAVQDVQARVSAAMRNMPRDLDPPVINKTNPEDRPIMWVALTGPRSAQELADIARNSLRDRFLTVPGNGDVQMGGYLERNIRIWIDPAKLNARNLTVDQVSAAIQRQHAEVPAGRMESTKREANVRVQGEALNLDEWRNLILSERDGVPIRLGEVALVEDGFEDLRRISRVNGVPAQGLGIIKRHGANTVEVAQQVRKRVAEINSTLPEDLTLGIRFDSSKYIEAAIHETNETLVLAVLLTAVVCWLFLGSLSSTFNVVLAIPVSVLGTFAVMYFAGFTLNTFTLLALSLSIGIVVDDAIMVLENIYRHGEMGKTREQAAKDGAEQIQFAAFATTLAIIAIFLPVAFMSGVIGKFFFQFGVVLSVAVLISLIEALTLTPSRCAQFLNVSGRQNVLERAMAFIFNGLAAVYRRILAFCLGLRTQLTGKALGFVACLASLAFGATLLYSGGNGLYQFFAGRAGDEFEIAWVLSMMLGLLALLMGAGLLALTVSRESFPTGSLLVLAASLAVFAFSLLPLAGPALGQLAAWIPQLKSEMVPSQDQGVYRVMIRTPVGASFEYTNEVATKIEAMLAKREEIDNVYMVVGGFSGDANQAFSFVTLKPQEERKISQAESINELRRALNVFPGTSVIIMDPSTEGLPGSRGRSQPVQFSLRGPSWDRLGQLSQELSEAMTQSGKLVDVDTDYRVGMPEVTVTPNRDRILAHEADVLAVSEAIRTLIGGSKIAKFTRDGRRYDVRVRLLRDERTRPEDIGGLYVRNKKGNLIRLSELVDVQLKPSLQSITRQDRERAVSISASPAPGVAQADALKEVEKLAATTLPDGYRIYFSGQARTFRESMDSLLFALALGVLVAYMILASQFNSFIHPLTILLALPFSITGALLGLLAWGQTINMYSMIGIILLTGIAKKNSILLVEFTNQLREHGKSRDEALLEACPVRLRPILMTSIATIAGALPGALASGAGAELRVPMSVTVISGMIVSTLLTLFVIPCFYAMADEAGERMKALWRKAFPAQPGTGVVKHAAGD